MSESIVERFVKNEEFEVQTFRDNTKHLRVSDNEGKFCRFERLVGKAGEVSLGFGKFKGVPLEDLDSGYINWLVEADWCKEELKRTFDYLKKNGNLLVSV